MTVRAAAAVIALALLASLSALGTSSVTATELGQRIGSARRGQSYWEAVMLQADRLVSRLDRGRDRVRRDLRRADRSLKKIKAQRASARRVLRSRVARVRHLEAKLPPEGEPVPPWITRKLRAAQGQEHRAKTNQLRLGRAMMRIQRTRGAKHRRMSQHRRALRAAVGRREAAESALGSLIVAATRLAQQRAELKTYVRLGTEGSFVWPSAGSITQGYGCTGYAANPPRGSCRNFHDGLDISPSGGSRIGSVATGVVAYAGWNPWDSEGRAFIVVVGHADGYVSRYGHLVPNRRVARAGQVVYRGQTVGYMGSTGNSTGVHLHLEILHGGSTIDPRSLFPDRGDDGKATKSGKHKGKSRAKPVRARRGADRRARSKGEGAARDRRDDAASMDVEAALHEATALPADAASGLTVQFGARPDGCLAPTGADAPSVRDRHDGPPTLGELAAHLRDRAAACDGRAIEMPEAERGWPSSSSPWDLSVFDRPEGTGAG